MHFSINALIAAVVDFLGSLCEHRVLFDVHRNFMASSLQLLGGGGGGGGCCCYSNDMHSIEYALQWNDKDL